MSPDLKKVILPLNHSQKKNKGLAGLLREQVLSYVWMDKSFHQRGVVIMKKNYKEIKVEMVEGSSYVTPNASLLFTAKFFEQSGLSGVIDANIGARKGKGASDSQHIMAMVMSQICGNDAIEHQKHLSSRVDVLGIDVPSVSACRSYMNEFHNSEEDHKRGMGCSFIPESNVYLSGFEQVHAHVFKTAYNLSPLESVTLDQDATFILTDRPDVCRNYKGETSYEAFNTYCPEYDVMVGTRYSDGNVSPGFKQLEELKRVLSLLPEGVKQVKLRSDSAGYQMDLMKYCARNENKRFGTIDFAISCDVFSEFKGSACKVPESAWRPLRRDKYETSRLEWAEVAYVSNNLARSKEDPEIRYYAIRESFKQPRVGSKKVNDAPGQMELDFELTEAHINELETGCPGLKDLHLVLMSGKIYKLFGIASNIKDQPGSKIIRWHRERCGKSEQAHDILKNEFGGGHVPSHYFGVNASWWNIAVLSMNVISVMKRFFLPFGYGSCRMKRLRYIFFTIVGRIVTHARRTILKVYSGDTGARILMSAINKLNVLMPCVT